MQLKHFLLQQYEIIDEVVIIYYKVFVNDQPTSLPLDHVRTLENSFSFWEEREFDTDNQKAKVKFEITNFKQDANVWITWNSPKYWGRSFGTRTSWERGCRSDIRRCTIVMEVFNYMMLKVLKQS